MKIWLQLWKINWTNHTNNYLYKYMRLRDYNKRKQMFTKTDFGCWKFQFCSKLCILNNKKIETHCHKATDNFGFINVVKQHMSTDNRKQMTSSCYCSWVFLQSFCHDWYSFVNVTRFTVPLPQHQTMSKIEITTINTTLSKRWNKKRL